MLHTYNKFIDDVNDNFASLHLQIQRFESGFVDNMGVTFTEDTAWPVMYLSIQDVVALENSVDAYNIRVYFLDLLEKDDSNEKDVLSDQLSIGRDFINWLKLNDNLFNVLNNPRAVPVKSIIMDYTAGWYIDIEVEVETEGSDCSIPFSGSTTPPITCPVSYVENSDGSYSVELTSGETLILPDIELDLNSITRTFPSVKDITLSVENTVGDNVGSFVGNDWVIDDTTLNINGTQDLFIPAEDTFNLLVRLNGAQSGSYNIGDQAWDVTAIVGPATVENSNQSYTDTVNAEDTLVLPNIFLLLNSTFPLEIPSVVNISVTIANTDDDPVGFQDGGTFRIPDSEIDINGTPFASVPATDNLSIDVKNTAGVFVGLQVGNEFIIDDNQISINGNFVDSVPANTAFLMTATLDGVEGGTYNAGTNTLSFTSAQILVTNITVSSTANSFSFVVDADTAGTYTSINNGGLASFVLTKNGTPTTAPFSVVATDTIAATFTVLGSATVVKLTGTY